ncbi:MAG: tetratricopeptide repeat protein [Paracoccaceae bacterium]
MRGHRLSGVICILGMLAFAGVPAHARISDIPGYNRMLAEDFAAAPTLQFADAAETAGDPDAAIAALEQLLVREPDNLQAHRRLARLYDRVGNEALAEVHRDRAGLPPRTQVWGRATVGFAHETNPTASPTDDTVPIFSAANNALVQVAAGAERADQLATVRLDLNLAHGLSANALLAAEVSLDSEIYSATEQLDNLRIRGRIGPWLQIPALGEGASIRPFISGGAGMLDNAPYYGQIGAGVVLNLPLSDDLALSLLSDLGYTDYSGAIFSNFDADTFDNLTIRAGGQLGGRAGGFGYGVYAFGGYTAAAADQESYVSVRTGATASTAVPRAEGFLGVPVLLRLGTSVDWFSYDTANPTIDPATSRQDLWVGGNAALVLGLTDDLDMTLGAEYTHRFSNLELFESQNLRVFMELGLDF